MPYRHVEYIYLFMETLNALDVIMDNVIIKEIHAMVQMSVVRFLGFNKNLQFWLLIILWGWFWS